MSEESSLKTIYVTKNKEKTIDKYRNKHPLIFTALNHAGNQSLGLIRTQRHQKQNIAFVLSPEEFAALSEAMLKNAIVLRE